MKTTNSAQLLQKQGSCTEQLLIMEEDRLKTRLTFILFEQHCHQNITHNFSHSRDQCKCVVTWGKVWGIPFQMHF